MILYYTKTQWVLFYTIHPSPLQSQGTQDEEHTGDSPLQDWRRKPNETIKAQEENVNST